MDHEPTKTTCNLIELLNIKWINDIDPNNPLLTKGNQFPHTKSNLQSKYYTFETEMYKTYHSNVNQTLAAAQPGSIFTDHGENHVRTVISNAGALIGNVDALNGYEIFLLLISIHFHDLGNIYGREEHEQKISKLMELLKDKLPIETAERGFITEIATAHGGYIENDKDTISELLPKDVYDNIDFRPRALAAILRLADEIADNYHRALETPPFVIPDDSRIHHEYCKSLEPVTSRGETLKFHYRIPFGMTQDKLLQDKTEVYLYDFIRKRLVKTMVELEYCKNHSSGLIKQSTVSVTIDFLKQNHTTDYLERNEFRLCLNHYPASDTYTIDHFLERKPKSGTPNLVTYPDGSTLQQAMLKKAGAI